MTKIISKEVSYSQYVDQVWRYRELIYVLARRDLKIKYAQTLLGVFWSVLQPLTGLLIFTLFFDSVLNIEIPDDIPYPLFAFSGMISWYFFSYIVVSGGNSLVESQDIIKRIKFPKFVLPLSKVLVGLVDLVISFALMIGLMLLLGRLPGWQIVFFPFCVLVNVVVGLAVSVWLSAMTIRYRDFYHIIPYLINFGIWLTPVFYPATLIPEKYSFLIYGNPMAAVIALFRWSILGGSLPSLYYGISLILVVLILILGFFYFKKMERLIADYV